MTIKKALLVLALAAVVIGCYFRLVDIKNNRFFYYDEGLYYTYHRPFDEILVRNQPHTLGQFLSSLKYNFYLSLGTGKPLWVFILHMRSFWGHFDAFYLSKILSAWFGVLNLPITYLFARRYFKS